MAEYAHGTTVVRAESSSAQKEALASADDIREAHRDADAIP